MSSQPISSSFILILSSHLFRWNIVLFHNPCLATCYCLIWQQIFSKKKKLSIRWHPFFHIFHKNSPYEKHIHQFTHKLHLHSSTKQSRFMRCELLILTRKKCSRLCSGPKTNCNGTRSSKQLGRPGELATWFATKTNVFLSNGNVSNRKAAISSRISHSIYNDEKTCFLNAIFLHSKMKSIIIIMHLWIK